MSIHNLLNQFMGATNDANSLANPANSIGNTLNKLTGNIPGGLAGGAAAGGIMALLVSSKSARKVAGTAATYGGAALLGGLAYRARSILQARAMIEQGAPAGSAVRAARLWGEDPRQAAAGVSRYTMAEVLRFPALLLEADRTLKSRALAPRAVLGSLLEKMMTDTGRQPRGQK